MPHFLNGGFPFYQGSVFNNETELLELIRDNLVLAGWTVVNDAIATSQLLLMQGIDGTHNNWFKFTTQDNNVLPNGKDLIVQGDLDGTDTNLSPGDIKGFFLDNAENRFWLTADTGAFGIALDSFNGETIGIHGGFLDREEPTTDEFAWMVGFIDNKPEKKYIAKDTQTGSIWHQIYSRFNNNNPEYAPLHGVSDLYTICSNPYFTIINPNGGGLSDTNPGYNYYNGNKNGYDQNVLVSEYFHLEGLTSYTNGATANSLYYRGKVKFCGGGLSSLNAKENAVDAATGGRYLSTGGLRSQGLLIVEGTGNNFPEPVPVVKLNGGAGEPGFLFTDTNSLLVTIRDNLLTAGWTTHNDEIASNNRVTMLGVSGTHNAYIRFEVVDNSGVSNGKYLQVRGDLDGTATNLSGDTVRLDFIEGSDNRLWLTADADAGVVKTFPFSGDRMAAHFGFLQRLDPTNDEFAWMVGHVNTKLSHSYIAKTAIGVTNVSDVWFNQIRHFAKNSVDDTGRGWGTYQGIFDRYTVPCKNVNNTYTSSNYNAFLGALNALNGLPKLGRYFYTEGRGVSGSFSVSQVYPPNGVFPAQLFFRGFVKFAHIGLASQVGGFKFTTDSGKIIMSGGDLGWQGIEV